MKNYFNYAQWVLFIWGLAFVFSMQICIFWKFIKVPTFKPDMMEENGQKLPNDYMRFGNKAIKEF